MIFDMPMIKDKAEPIGTVESWGQPLDQEKIELVVGNVKQLNSTGLTGAYDSWVATGKIGIVDNVDHDKVAAAAKLKQIAAKLEDDIAYFQLLKGQNLAIHKFATLKLHIMEAVKLLEK